MLAQRIVQQEENLNSAARRKGLDVSSFNSMAPSTFHSSNRMQESISHIHNVYDVDNKSSKHENLIQSQDKPPTQNMKILQAQESLLELQLQQADLKEKIHRCKQLQLKLSKEKDSINMHIKESDAGRIRESLELENRRLQTQALDQRKHFAAISATTIQKIKGLNSELLVLEDQQSELLDRAEFLRAESTKLHESKHRLDAKIQVLRTRISTIESIKRY